MRVFAIIFGGMLISSCGFHIQPKKIIKAEALVIDRTDHEDQTPASICPTCPRHMRTSQDVYHKASKVPKLEKHLDGLNSMRISGSAQYSQAQGRTFLTNLKNSIFLNYAFKDAFVPPININRIIVVDVREETHAYLNYDNPLSPANKFEWLSIRNSGYYLDDNAQIHPNQINRGLTPKQIKENELDFIKTLNFFGGQYVPLRYKDVGTHNTTGVDVLVNPYNHPVAISEAELLANLDEEIHGVDIQYARFYVTDGKIPDEKTTNDFYQLLDSLSHTDWIHVHCLGGSGRTTTFWMLYDMYTNQDTIRTQKIPLEAVLLRNDFFNGKEFGEDIAEEGDVYQYLKTQWENII